MNAWSSGYPVGKPHRTCARTGKPINVGDHYIAALIENDQTRQVERRDYALEAWQAAGPRGPVSPSHLVGFWRSTMPRAEDKPKPILDDEAMLDLFGATEGAGGSRADLRLVLALLMIRRRLLTHESTRFDNGQSVMLVRPRGTPKPPEGPPFLEVPDPGLDETALASVLAELEGLGVQDDEPAASAAAGGAQ